MIDFEVERLRRVRGSALRMRAIARALRDSAASTDDRRSQREDVFNRARCAAWRVVRTVSGRLRAHPYAPYQQDVGLGRVFTNSLLAAAASFVASSRHRALLRLDTELKSVMREVDDARALTHLDDLSDNLGRSQRELRVLLAALTFEIQDSAPTARGAGQSRQSPGNTAAAGTAARVPPDSPFLTI